MSKSSFSPSTKKVAKKRLSSKQRVLKVWPRATLIKSNIASWGVCNTGQTGEYLSYGEAMPYLAWRRAADKLP